MDATTIEVLETQAKALLAEAGELDKQAEAKRDDANRLLELIPQQPDLQIGEPIQREPKTEVTTGHNVTVVPLVDAVVKRSRWDEDEKRALCFEWKRRNPNTKSAVAAFDEEMATQFGRTKCAITTQRHQLGLQFYSVNRG